MSLEELERGAGDLSAMDVASGRKGGEQDDKTEAAGQLSCSGARARERRVTDGKQED